jgi:hypothetical protein
MYAPFKPYCAIMILIMMLVLLSAGRTELARAELELTVERDGETLRLKRGVAAGG